MTSFQTRSLFYSAAVFNWAAVLLLTPWLGLPTLLGLEAAGNSIYDHIALLAIAGFGYGYWMAGRAPTQHRGLILLGALMKLGVVAIIFGHVLLGDSPINMAALVSGDLVYAVLFLVYLKRSSTEAISGAAA